MRYLLLIAFVSLPAQAVPVIPSFNSGSTTAKTTSKQNTTELIEQWTYSTGYEYSIGGTNLNIQGDLLPTTVTTGSHVCLLYTSPSPRDATLSRMPSSA